MTGVYNGLTVVELADRRNQWAGKLLSDGGARVIQIEPVVGSPGRWCGPFVDDEPDPNHCIDYWWYNTGKESLVIDISRPVSGKLIRDLLSRADVFLDSASPGTLAEFGLDYPSLASNKALIHVSLTDFGQDGPWRDYAMNDHAHLALGGQMSSSGYSDPKETPIGGQGRHAWHMGCAFVLHGITVRPGNRGRRAAMDVLWLDNVPPYRHARQSQAAAASAATNRRWQIHHRGDAEFRHAGLELSSRLDGREGRVG